jgi:hypothetical protein
MDDPIQQAKPFGDKIMTETQQLNGNEFLENCPNELTPATVHQFWQRTFSDLNKN